MQFYAFAMVGRTSMRNESRDRFAYDKAIASDSRTKALFWFFAAVLLVSVVAGIPGLIAVSILGCLYCLDPFMRKLARPTKGGDRNGTSGK